MNQKTINVDSLQTMLSNHEKVTILDIRSSADFQEWHIPDSIHFDVTDALKVNDETAFSDIMLERNIPIVTLCTVGNQSQAVAQQLYERGYRAMSLTGGMQAWSLAWNWADVPICCSDVEIIQIRRTGKGCLSYLVGSDGEAAVIDPSLDPAVYLDLAQQRGWKITHVLDTHIHADHLSRNRVLVQQADATLYLPQQERINYEYAPLHDGDVVFVGSTEIYAIQTAGHTPESMSYLVNEEVLLTGDTLFLTAIGRPDLLTNSEEQARQKAILLYRSLQQIMKLPANTTILPGHTDNPVAFDDRVIGAPLSQVIQKTTILTLDEAAFVDNVLQHLPAMPPNHNRIATFNEAGNFPVSEVIELESGANRCAIG